MAGQLQSCRTRKPSGGAEFWRAQRFPRGDPCPGAFAYLGEDRPQAKAHQATNAASHRHEMTPSGTLLPICSAPTFRTAATRIRARWYHRATEWMARLELDVSREPYGRTIVITGGPLKMDGLFGRVLIGTVGEDLNITLDLRLKDSATGKAGVRLDGASAHGAVFALP